MAKVIPEKRWLSNEQIMQCGSLARATTRYVIDPDLAAKLSLQVVRGKKLPIDFEAVESWGVTLNQTPLERN
ncbi:MAG: hypothetical protein PHG25_02310 [Candidatus Pacebacteria bacterium]|nr:hypothetical protein [Candidatus Paceibacterota bacterium]